MSEPSISEVLTAVFGTSDLNASVDSEGLSPHDDSNVDTRELGVSQLDFLKNLASPPPKIKLPEPTNTSIPRLRVEPDELSFTTETFFRTIRAGLPVDDLPPVKKMLDAAGQAELEKRLFSDPKIMLAKLRTAAFKEGKFNVVKLVTLMIREVEERKQYEDPSAFRRVA